MKTAAENWNDVNVRCISEILQSVEVIIQSNIILFHDLISCYNNFIFLLYYV